MIFFLSSLILGSVGADRYCTVGFGKIGRHSVISDESLVTWERFCGTKDSVDYCYRAETDDYTDMQKLYPERDWEDGKDYFEKYFILGCGGDFHHQKTSCKKKIKKQENTIWVYNATADNGKTYIRSLKTTYCCKENYCSGARSSHDGLQNHLIWISSIVGVGVLWMLQ